MAISYYNTELLHYILVQNEGTSEIPINYKTITDYFAANPLALNQKFPSSGDLCEANLAGWSVYSGNADAPTEELTIKQVGNNSVKWVKNGTGNFVALWNAVPDPILANYFSAAPAEKIKIWVRVSNVAIKLDSIIFDTAVTTTYPITYSNGGNGWNFAADTWTEITLDVRADCTTKIYRAYFTSIATIKLQFSGGVSSDVVYIDGLRLELPDPNPKRLYSTNIYVFPQALYVGTSYFSDSGFIHICNALNGTTGESSFYGNSCPKLYVGDYYKGGVIFVNNFSSDNSGAQLTFGGTDVKVLGMTFISPFSISLADGAFSYWCQGLTENCNFYRAGDINTYLTTVMKNIVVGSARYALREPASAATFIDYTYYSGSGYITINDVTPCTLRKVKPVGFTSGQRILYARNYTYQKDFYHYYIDFDLSETDGLIRTYLYNVALGYKFYQYIQFTFNLKVTDNEGNPIDQATVVIKDKDDNIVVNTITGVDGTISEQTITARYKITDAPGNPGSINVDWNCKTGGTFATPHTMTIIKAGYQDYSDSFTLDNKLNWQVALINTLPPVFVDGNFDGVIAEEAVDAEIVEDTLTGQSEILALSGEVSEIEMSE